MTSTDLSRFYGILALLEAQPGQGLSLSEYTGRSGLPARGVYFFREPGEYRTLDRDVLRVVRVGTHAVSANSRSTLWGRLRAHRGAGHGGGNHRGSIFRRHVGDALLARDSAEAGHHPTWGKGSSAARAVRDTEAGHEQLVSAHIGRMSILWVEVPDEPGRDSLRAYIERNAIALLSNGLNPLDPPSDDWLGSHSPYPEIVRSGLWNLNHVGEQYDAEFLRVLHEFVIRTGHTV